MNASIKCGLGVVFSALMISSAQAATINTTYEFDTPEKQALWTVTATPRYAAFTPVPGYYLNGVTYTGDQRPLPLSPGDGNWTRTGTLDFVIRIDAPAGEVFTTIEAEADASGFVGWNYSTNIQLSSDGVNFDVQSATPNTSNATEHVTAVATGEPGFTSLSSVWLKIHLFDELGFYDGAERYARVENISFFGETQAVPEPAGLISAAGAALLIIRRRRR